MIYTIEGLKIVDFVNDDGEKVQGVRLYTSHPDEEDDSFYGKYTSSFFFGIDNKHYPKIRNYVEKNSLGLTPDDLCGMSAELEFNEQGKIRKFNLLALDKAENVPSIAPDKLENKVEKVGKDK